MSCNDRCASRNRQKASIQCIMRRLSLMEVSDTKAHPELSFPKSKDARHQSVSSSLALVSYCCPFHLDTATLAL